MEAAASQTSPWDAVRAGLSTFLDACLEPAFRRIVVLDSVSVLQAKVLEVGIDPVELPMLRTVLTPLLGTTTFEGMAARRAHLRRPRRSLRRVAVHRPRFGPALRPEPRSTSSSTPSSAASSVARRGDVGVGAPTGSAGRWRSPFRCWSAGFDELELRERGVVGEQPLSGRHRRRPG